MSFLSSAVFIGHSNCSMRIQYSPTVHLMRAVADLSQAPRSSLQNALLTRALCIGVAVSAVIEAGVHLGLSAAVVVGTLATRAAVVILHVTSWALILAKYYAYHIILDVSTANWSIRILTEVGVLITSPRTFISQWRERMSWIFWASSTDSRLWDLAKSIDLKCKDFLNYTHFLYHAKKLLVFAIAAVSIPCIGVANPELAYKKFRALGMEPQHRSRLARFFSHHWGKMAFLGVLAGALAYDYRTRGFSDPQVYAQDLCDKGMTQISPVKVAIEGYGKRAKEYLSERLFGESIDPKRINQLAEEALRLLGRLNADRDRQLEELTKRLATLEDAARVRCSVQVLNQS